jgi:hypothetical protein
MNMIGRYPVMVVIPVVETVVMAGDEMSAIFMRH